MVGIHSVADYSPFGVELDGRTESNSGYRFKFNGMEADDEIKGSGNSYDFGARMLDSRVGRWLTIDPMAKKQPDQSTYKAMLNNPLVWTDPTGQTEYETIVIKNKSTGKTTKVYKSISNKVMTNGKVFASHPGALVPALYQYYYDYRKVTYITIEKDGSETTRTATEILYKNGMKHRDNVTMDYVFGNEAEKYDTYDPDDKFEMAGGFYMTGENGQGTKYYSKNAEYVGNIDALLGILSNYSASGKLTIPDELKGPNGGWEMIETLMEQLDKGAEKIDKIQEIIEAVEDEFGSDGSGIPIKAPENGDPELSPGDTIITINQWDRKPFVTTNHPKDTVVKKDDVEKVNQNREWKGN